VKNIKLLWLLPVVILPFAEIPVRNNQSEPGGMGPVPNGTLWTCGLLQRPHFGDVM